MAMVGTFANILSEIKRRINSCVPTLYSTDPFTYIDQVNSEGENNTNPFLFRHFYVEITDSQSGDFAGNYAYKNKNCTLTVSLFYNLSGANRVLGTDDINFRAFLLQDADDIENKLKPVILTDDGSTARLICKGPEINEEDANNLVVVINYEMPVFLRGNQLVPSLYIGPDQNYTLNAGDKFYLVVQSNLGVEVSITSTPAGLTHVSSMVLGSGTPGLLECTVDTAGTYLVSIAGANGTDSATVQVWPDSDYVYVGPDIAIPNDVWTYNLAVAARDDGVLPVTGSANLVLPENVTISGSKGVIPITITARGNHTVTVGEDTCNLTSATPAAKVPQFNNELSVDWAYATGRQAGAYSPYSPHYYTCLSTPVDNIKKFTIAYRFKAQATVASTNYYGFQPPYYFNTNYINWAIRQGSSIARSFTFYFRNAQDTATRGPYYISGTGHIPVDTWVNIYITYEFNVVTRVGKLNTYANDVLRYEYNLTDLDEMGFFHSSMMNRELSIEGANPWTTSYYDVYICSDLLWTSTEIAQFQAKQVIDPSKYSIYWPMTKNTDLPYLVDYDLKNNVPLYIPGPHPNLEWVAKP